MPSSVDIDRWKEYMVREMYMIRMLQREAKGSKKLVVTLVGPFGDAVG